MVDSVRNRWLIAFGFAVVSALLFTTLFSAAARRAETRGDDAVAIWKARTGVDLAAYPRMHPPHPDSDDAHALDTLLEPIGLKLTAPTELGDHPEDRMEDEDDLTALRDALREAIRSQTTEAKPLAPNVVAAIERRNKALDAVADFVAHHPDIRWAEGFGPRRRLSRLYTNDHLILHRLLVGRAFLALERKDASVAARMLATSQALNHALEVRHELWSQFVATGVERLQLALLRRAGRALNVAPAAPTEGIRERYVDGMSAEAIVTLANARQDPFTSRDAHGPERVLRLLAGPKLELAASEMVRIAAETVDEIKQSQDGCAELNRQRRKPRSVLAGDFFAMNATEAWRRFVVLELDRAITTAVLTGQTTSPCASVTIAVGDEGSTRTVTSTGLPAESDAVISVPAVVKTQR